MWIDAICINQEDLGERSSQVSFMTNIYAAAARVVVWLGKDDNEDQSCFPLFSTIARHRQQNELMEQSLRQLDDNDSFKNLLQSPWFSRVWVSIPSLSGIYH